MVEITVSVKYHSINTCSDCAFGDKFANLCGHFAFRATLFYTFLARGSCGQCHTLYIVNNLCINFLIASEHRQSGHLGSATDLMTNAEFNFCSSYIFSCSHNCLYFGVLIIFT